MKPAYLLAPVALLAALVLSSCGSPTEVTLSPTAQDLVSVSATGTAKATPDAMKASIMVESKAATTELAQANAATAMDAITTALSDGGVEDKDVATTSISVTQTYDYTPTGQKPTGYAASQSVDVTLRDLDAAGPLLDRVVAAGGNDTRIGGTSLIVTDPVAAQDKAREDAISKAQTKAEQYAKALGFTLGPVASVSESTTMPAPYPMYAADAAAGAAEAAPSTKVSAGTSDITVDVSVAWHIK